MISAGPDGRLPPLGNFSTMVLDRRVSMSRRSFCSSGHVSYNALHVTVITIIESTLEFEKNGRERPRSGLD